MDKEKWAQIRMMKTNGLGIRAIARMLGISKNTVKRTLLQEFPSPDKRKRSSFSPLLPFKEEILKMRQKKLIGSRIFNELRKLGYRGGQTSFYAFLNEIKKEEGFFKAKERFETTPGEQAQFDWSYYTVDFSGRSVKVVVFCLLFSFSRRKFYWGSTNDNQVSVFEAIEKGFWHFGAVTRELLVDNARCFVSNANPAHFTWNQKFLEFCGYYRVKPAACRIRRPQTKGKVERPFFYLENHFIKGRAFRDFNDFCTKLSQFSLELDLKIHPTTGFRPIERFEEEKEFLTALPVKPFLSCLSCPRKVSWDCLVSFGKARYSVPYQFASKHVWVGVSQGETLEITSSAGEVVAVHKISASGATVIDKSHYEGLRQVAPRTLPVLKKAFLEKFPQSELFLEKLLAQYKNHPERHIRGILELSSFYSKEKVLESFNLALKYNTFSHNFIRGIIQNQDEEKEEKIPLPSLTLSEVPKLSIKRNLKTYQLFLEEGGEKE